jgi:hypothetical protein
MNPFRSHRSDRRDESKENLKVGWESLFFISSAEKSPSAIR